MLNLINKYKLMPQVAKATLWFIICNFFLTGLGFITAPIFTRLISPEEYGKNTLFLSYEQIILIFATWEIYSGAYQKGLFKYSDEKFFRSSTIALMNIITIVCFILVVGFYPLVSDFTQITNVNLLFLFAYLMLFPAYQMWIIKKRKEYDYQKAVPVTILFSITSIIISFLAVYYIEPTADVRFATTLLIGIAFSIYFYLNSLSVTSLGKNKDLVKEQWKFLLVYQGPLVLHSLSYFVLNQMDRIMIGKMVGNKETAFYGVAYSLAMAISILQNSLNQTLGPWRYSKLQNKEYGIIMTSTNSLLILIGGVIILFVLVAPDLMKLLFTTDYYEAVWCIPPVAAGVYFMFLYSIFVNIETYYEKTMYVMLVSVTCGLINVGLNYICIPLYGYVASAYTTLVSYILFALLHYVAAKMIMKKQGGITNIFSTSKLLIISSAFLGLTFVAMSTFDFAIFRYSLIMCAIVICFIKRNTIMKVVKLRH